MRPLRDSPVFHDWPARMLCAYDMHRELQRPAHSFCTVGDCLMKRYCWDGLVGLGHNPALPGDECPVCDKDMSERYRFTDGTTMCP